MQCVIMHALAVASVYIYVPQAPLRKVNVTVDAELCGYLQFNKLALHHKLNQKCVSFGVATYQWVHIPTSMLYLVDGLSQLLARPRPKN